MTENARKRLSNFNFEGEGSHVALVGKHQGGPANGVTTLLTKATKGITDDQLEKATMVQVEMNIVDFLTTFFNLWYDDAIVLARIMGLDVEPEPDTEEYVSWYQEWLDERVDAVTLMKSLVMDKSEAEINKAIANLKPEELLLLLETQKKFEQALSSQEGVTVSPDTTSPSVEKSNNKGNEMSEFVTKAVHEKELSKAVELAVAKAVEEKDQELVAKQAELDTALEVVKGLEAKEKESVEKGRKAVLKDAGVAEDDVEVLYKSTEALSTEAFETVVKAMAKDKKAVEESDLFKEQGVSGEAVTVTEEDGVAALTKSYQEKFNKKEGK
jgi:hypothetical protein